MPIVQANSLADCMDFKVLDRDGVFESPPARKDDLYKSLAFLFKHASRWAGSMSPDEGEFEQDCEHARDALRELIHEAFKPRENH